MSSKEISLTVKKKDTSEPLEEARKQCSEKKSTEA
jgi:hypothetical protein